MAQNQLSQPVCSRRCSFLSLRCFSVCCLVSGFAAPCTQHTPLAHAHTMRREGRAKLSALEDRLQRRVEGRLTDALASDDGAEVCYCRLCVCIRVCCRAHIWRGGAQTPLLQMMGWRCVCYCRLCVCVCICVSQGVRLQRRAEGRLTYVLSAADGAEVSGENV